MSVTNSAAAAAESPVEQVPDEDDNWSIANCFLKYVLACVIGCYLFVAVLSGDWALPEDSRQFFIFSLSWAAPIFICLIGTLKALEFKGKVRRIAFWCVVTLEFACGVASWFLQPYMGELTFLGNRATGIPAHIAFVIGSTMVVGWVAKKVFL